MLQFIFGRAGSGKTFKIQQIIAELVQSGAEKLMLIVPEQSSFETEKAMLIFLGEQAASKIQVSTFTRLIDVVLRKTGGGLGQRISKGDRNLLMSLAIDNVAGKLAMYKGQADKLEFVEMMVAALSEFKMCNVDYNSLLEVSKTLQDPILRAKVQDTSLILEAYENLLQTSYFDPLDDLSRLAQRLTQCDSFFSGYTVMFDGFEGFTPQQMTVIEKILKQSKNCYISLCIESSGFLDDTFNLFAPINRTAKKILNIAKSNNLQVNEPICLENSRKFKSNGLKMLEAQTFRDKKDQLFEEIDDVLMFNGKTKYEEADFVCRTIKRLVYECGYKYGDFAVVTRNEETYRGIMDVFFEKYEIPYFMDRRDEIDAKPLMLTVIYALEAVNSNFSSDSIFKLLKTGLVNVAEDDVFELENYCLFWHITGGRWLSDFTANPDGYTQMTVDEEEKLAKLNRLRASIIAPLAKLKEAISNATGDAITVALYEFLEEINTIERLQIFCKNLSASGLKKIAEEQPRLWEILIEIFDKMSTILMGKKISPKKYAKLLRLVINSNDIAFIPHRIDEVDFGSIDRIRSRGVKVAFLIGAVEGEFPRSPAISGIFNDKQRKQLISMGLPLYDSLEGLSGAERFLAYKAMALPSDKLYITWSSSTSLGGAKSPSEIVRETKFVLPKVKCLDSYSISLSDEIWAYKPTFEVCARHWSNVSRFSQTLKQFFVQDKSHGYDEKLKLLEKVASNLPIKLASSRVRTDLFGQDIKLSASQIEKFYLCKFAYFCKYGLLAKERKEAQFNVLQYGNIVHFIFEKILKKYTAEEILKFSKKELYGVIQNISKIYVERELGGWTEKANRFRYLFDRVSRSVVALITHMAEELSQSAFLPVGFELKLSQETGIEPLKIKLPNGHNVTVEGKIDRVDVMRQAEQCFVRVIDYKTGAKEFRLADTLHGLNLQMLIYLEAVCQATAKSQCSLKPAGVLYLPSVSPVLNLDRDENLSKLESEKSKKLRMNGIILNSQQVILGMEPDGKGRYIPVTMKNGEVKACDSLVDVAQMNAIMQHINRLIIFMAEQLQNGNIAAQPAKGDYDACEFCEYKAACSHFKQDTARKFEKIDRDEFFKKLELEQNEGECNA